MSGDPDPHTPGLGVYFGAIRRKLWLVLVFGAVGLGLSAYVVSRTETMFSSTTVVQLPEERGSAGGGGLAGLAASVIGGAGSMASQVEVMRSRTLLGEVVDSLGLRLHRQVSGFPNDRSQPVGWLEDVWVAPGIDRGDIDFSFGPELVQIRSGDRAVEVPYGEPVDLEGIRFVVSRPQDLEDARLYVVSRNSAIDALQQSIRVYPRDGTDILDLVADGYDRQITRTLADAVAVTYRAYTMGNARQEAEQRRRYLEQQLVVTDSLLLETQDELTEFRQQEGLYSLRSQAMADQGGLSDLQVLESELLAERQVAQALVQRLREHTATDTNEALRAIISSPVMGNNVAIQTAYEALREYQVEREGRVSGWPPLSPTHPDVVRLDRLIRNTEADLLALAQGHVESIDAQLGAVEFVRSRVNDVFQHLAAAEPLEARLVLRLDAITDAASELRAQYYSAGTAEASVMEQVTILDFALPGNPTGPGPGRSLLLGMIFGLMVGSAGAIMADAANRSIRRREDVERVLRVPGLGIIPPMATSGAWQKLRLPGWSSGSGGANGGRPGAEELVAATGVHSAAAEAYRTVRTNLAGAYPGLTSKSIMVTSPSGGEGKTTTAANLAVAFAHQGRKVLLIDCDLRRPRLHTLFGTSQEPGLCEALQGSLDGRAAIQTTQVQGLSILPAGGVPRSSPADLIAGHDFAKLVEELGADFDMVILDSPPVLLMADTPILAPQVDGILVVLRVGGTDRETALYAVQQLASVGGNVIGAVLNDPDAVLSGQAGSYSGQYATR